MKRTRAVSILLKEDEVLLMYRKNTNEYFVFPGGGVEKGETVEQAVIRELKEEATIEAKINKLLYSHVYDDDTDQFFYLCDYVSGEPKLEENSPEKIEMLEGKEFYNPQWVKVEELNKMLVYPLEIRDLLIEDYKLNFTNPVKMFNFRVSDLRQSL